MKYEPKRLKNVSRKKMTSTQINNKKLIIIVYLNCYKNGKNEFS